MSPTDREDKAPAEDRSTEDPGNFRRTPPVDELQQDPLNSGRRFSSNQLLIGTMAIGSALGVGLALIYL